MSTPFFEKPGKPCRYTPLVIFLLLLAVVLAVFAGVYLWHRYGSSSAG